MPGERIVVAPLHRRHFLYVGDTEPRKNLGVLLAAYELYRAGSREPLELVVAGSVDARARRPGGAPARPDGAG